MDNEPKITIGIPTGGTVKTKTVLSLLGMIKKMPYRWNTVMRNACLVHTNREVITQKAIELGSTHLLFIDDDMTFESNDKGELVCGEDMWFCRKAIKAGYDIWADSTVKVGHLGEFEY